MNYEVGEREAVGFIDANLHELSQEKNWFHVAGRWKILIYSDLKS